MGARFTIKYSDYVALDFVYGDFLSLDYRVVVVVVSHSRGLPLVVAVSQHRRTVSKFLTENRCVSTIAAAGCYDRSYKSVTTRRTL